MKKLTRRIVCGTLLLLAATTAVIIFTPMPPPLHLQVVSRHPATIIQFGNDTGRELNFFYFTEVKSNGTCVNASLHPKGARAANNVKPHSIREFEIAPTPADATAWRVGVGCNRVGPWYFRLAQRFGLLKNYRAHYFDKKYVYTEFAH